MNKSKARLQNGKPALPAPTFKYSSSTYVVLAYAKLVNRPFSVKDIRNFTAKFTSNYDVVRSLKVLEKNGSVTMVQENLWQVTPVGIQQIYDFPLRRPSVNTND